jgi:hypothetical protein
VSPTTASLLGYSLKAGTWTLKMYRSIPGVARQCTVGAYGKGGDYSYYSIPITVPGSRPKLRYDDEVRPEGRASSICSPQRERAARPGKIATNLVRVQ